MRQFTTSAVSSDQAIAERDHEAIMAHLVGVAFPWDMQRSMVDLVFLKGLAAPRIAGMIGSFRYLQARPQKRYDDTTIVLIELVKHGYSSARGSQMIARMNQIHARFAIRQEDYVYVLTSLMFEPIRWNERFGWRQFSQTEKYANYYFWREVGKRMGITVIPDGYAACEQYNLDYEQHEFHRTNAAVALSGVMFRLLEGWMPAPVRPMVRPGLSALVSRDVLACFDQPPAPRWLGWLVPRVLGLRARVLRYWPRRRAARYYVDQPLRSYVDGYTTGELGPPADWTAERTPAPSAAPRS